MDERQQKRLTKQQQDWLAQDERARDAAVKALLEHADGRTYLYWLLEIGKAIGQNPFTGHALSTSFACGEQNIGQQVMAHILEVAPDGFLRMLKEKADERINRDRASAAFGDTASSGDGGNDYTAGDAPGSYID